MLQRLEPGLPAGDAVRAALAWQFGRRRSAGECVEVLADAVRDVRRGADLEAVGRGASERETELANGIVKCNMAAMLRTPNHLTL